MKDNELTPFEGKKIRKVWHDEQWFFAVIDVIAVLTDSASPSKYWNNIKIKENQLSLILRKFKFLAPDGKMRSTDCANTEGIFRIVMSVPSPKVEPLKLWLAEQGKRAIDEANDPELLTERQAELYRAKGYPDEWILKRVQTIKTRNKLTDEWKARGVKEGHEYSILTATIAKGTFGLTPSEHGELKGLDKQNLRDHMTDLELIFTALSEEVTRTITVKDDAQGFTQNHDAAAYGGDIARSARIRLETEKGVKVISSDNFLGLTGGDKPDELPPEKED
jgi:DNA-damage-inducible protein D